MTDIIRALDTIVRTGTQRHFKQWEGAGSEPWPSEGDFVDTDWHMYFLEVTPPTVDTSTLVQMGEPHDHAGFMGRARFATIQRAGLLWVYTGLRTYNERVEIR